jgi:alpha,alpha-trehalose phosphorylase
MRFAGRVIEVEVRRKHEDARDDQQPTYRLLEGPDFQTSHHGETLQLQEGQPVSRAVPVIPEPEPVSQPVGRAPRPRTLKG